MSCVGICYMTDFFFISFLCHLLHSPLGLKAKIKKNALFGTHGYLRQDQ